MYLQYRKTIAQKAHEWIMYWHDYDSLLEKHATGGTCTRTNTQHKAISCIGRWFADIHVFCIYRSDVKNRMFSLSTHFFSRKIHKSEFDWSLMNIWEETVFSLSFTNNHTFWYISTITLWVHLSECIHNMKYHDGMVNLILRKRPVNILSTEVADVYVYVCVFVEAIYYTI